MHCKYFKVGDIHGTTQGDIYCCIVTMTIYCCIVTTTNMVTVMLAILFDLQAALDADWLFNQKYSLMSENLPIRKLVRNAFPIWSLLNDAIIIMDRE